MTEDIPAGRAWDLATLVDTTTLRFDAGDQRNASLYVCEVSDGAQALIEALRAQGLWSDAEPKRVGEDHKEAYKSQLQFKEAREYRIGGHALVLLRGDHPKYPSDPARWDAWNRAAGALAARG